MFIDKVMFFVITCDNIIVCNYGSPISSEGVSVNGSTAEYDKNPVTPAVDTTQVMYVQYNWFSVEVYT